MFWTAFAQAMYGNTLPCTYDGEVQAEDTVTPLDPIDPSLVGCARTERLYRSTQRLGLSALTTIIAVIMSPHIAAVPRWLTNFDGGKEPPRRVSERYAEHIKELYRVGLLAPGTPRFHSGYFAVPKSRTTSRAIFNGKRLSRRCPAPGVVNLIDAQALVRRFIRHGRERGGRFEVVTGDLRHWFHQIRSPDHLQRLFGLRCGGANWVWTGLPMGWSWSPLVAQACAWAFLAHRNLGEAALLDEGAFKGGQLPTWVATPGGGFVVVYYDNYLVVTPDSNEAEAWRRRIQRNSAELQVQIKEGSQLRLSSAQFCETGFDYLGIHFQGERDRPSDKRADRLLWWPAKAAEWQAELADLEKTLPGSSCRKVASLVGRAVFGRVIGPNPLPATIEGRQLLCVARIIGKRAHRAGWSADASDVAVAAWRCLAGVTQLETDPYTADLTEVAAPAGGAILATDASKKGFGWIAFEERSGALVPESQAATHSHQWSEEESKSHIFLLEFRACMRALKWWCAAHPGETVLLVVDNAALAFSLRNRFSNNMVAMALLEEHAQELAAVSDVVLVVSQDNPADCPSRGSASDLQDRIARLKTALDARRQGWNWASGPCKKYVEEGKRPHLRHLYVELIDQPDDSDDEEELTLPLM